MKSQAGEFEKKLRDRVIYISAGDEESVIVPPSMYEKSERAIYILRSDADLFEPDHISSGLEYGKWQRPNDFQKRKGWYLEYRRHELKLVEVPPLDTKHDFYHNDDLIASVRDKSLGFYVFALYLFSGCQVDEFRSLLYQTIEIHTA